MSYAPVGQRSSVAIADDIDDDKELARSAASSRSTTTAHRRTNSISVGGQQSHADESLPSLAGGENQQQRRKTMESIRSIDDEIAFDIDDADPYSVNPASVRSNEQWTGGLKPRLPMSTNRILIGKIFANVVFILLWYCFSLSISLYNKWMFSEDYLNFKFPLFATSMHMITQTLLAGLVLYFIPRFRPRPEAKMTWKTYIFRVGSCGVATGGDIGLGNMSLRYITLGFYTMVKSSNLVFVLLFAFLMRLERPTFRLIGIITLMTIGVVMMVASETEFVLLGFLLALAAAMLSGLRWSLTQILLKSNAATSNPFSTIFYLAPVMCVTLFLLAIPIEGLGNFITAPVWREESFIMWVLILVAPGVIAFLMTSAEFFLLNRTNVITLSIVGIFKEVLTIGVSAGVYGDRLTVVNVSGLVLTLIAIALYNYFRIKSMREKIIFQQQQGGAAGASGGARMEGGASYVPLDEGRRESVEEEEGDEVFEMQRMSPPPNYADAIGREEGRR
ncbi:triose-phosphate transporter family-domain-containing protein [Myxozyma melibiosi]|uniref:Triose-phosphate transporter family-domain-containing protein n=1 Tax=Myxozyma melibiosi TaxID=54550 RepID=A0ABR1F6T6_9ASCO